MGNACGCADTVEKASELSIEQDEIFRRMHDDGSAIDDHTLKLLLQKIHLIVRMQAFFRGYRVRRQAMFKRKVQGTRAPRPFQSYASVDTNAIIGTGAAVDADLEFRPEHTFENGAIYKGQWNGNLRHGFGVQIWPDGAKYEGKWRNNKADGKGIFWHADGDVFDGEWREDKAHGFGTYTHVNGAKYEGEWSHDL